MASLEAKLAEVVTEAKNLRFALEKETEERRRDHDIIIKQGEQLKTLFAQLKLLQDAKAESGARTWQVWLALLTGVIAIIVAIGSKVFGGGKP